MLQTIGWIGTGNMGLPMSQNLIKAGYSLFVHDKVKEKANGAVQAGAKWSDLPLDLAKQSKYVFTMVPDGNVLNQIVSEISPSLTPEKVVIDMSTISPEESETCALQVLSRGSHFLRAPVSGGPPMAASADLGILCSGEKHIYEELQPVLKNLGNKFWYLGREEESRVVKLLVNILIGNSLQALSESIVLGEKNGIDVGTILDVIGKSAIASPFVNYKTPVIEKGEYQPQFSINLMKKDFALAQNLARSTNSPVPLTSLTSQFISAASNKHAEKDMTVLVKVLEEIAGISRNQK